LNKIRFENIIPQFSMLKMSSRLLVLSSTLKFSRGFFPRIFITKY
jgi:hypothetical protein